MRRQVLAAIEGINAQAFNEHYASISTDPDYITPRRKSSACQSSSVYIPNGGSSVHLTTYAPSATGPDELPAWFLRLGAPLFYTSVAQLFNLSVDTSTAPLQWKRASIS